MGDTYGHDDLIDLCHARPFARRGRLVVLSLACMEDSASTATDPGSHKAQSLSNVRAQSPVRCLNSGKCRSFVQDVVPGIAIGRKESFTSALGWTLNRSVHLQNAKRLSSGAAIFSLPRSALVSRAECSSAIASLNSSESLGAAKTFRERARI
jgi:hypothetical protein